MEGQHDKDKGDPGPCADPSATGPRPPDVSKSPGDPNPNPNCLRRTRKTAPAAGQVAAPTVTAPAPLEWGRQCQAPSSIPPLHVPPWHLSISGRCTAGVLRRLGYMESYQSALHLAQQYTGTAITCRYTIPPDLAGHESHQDLADVFDNAVARTILDHPMLQVGQADENSKRPSWIKLDSIDLARHVEWRIVTPSDDFGTVFESTLQVQLDTRYSEIDSRPGFRITVIRQEHEPSMDVIFAWYHAHTDGMGARIFHETLLRKLNTPVADSQLFTLTNRVLKLPGVAEKFPPAQERLAKYHVSPGYTITTAWKEFVTGAANPATWAPVQQKPVTTAIRSFSLDDATLQRVLAMCRENGTTLTGLFNAVVLVSLAERLEDAKARSFAALTARNMRPSTPADKARYPCAEPKGLVGNMVTVINHEFGAKEVACVRGTISAAAGGDRFETLAGTVWSVATRVRDEIRESVALGLKNNHVGLMSLVGDWRAFFKGKLEQPRETSWLVTNLGVFDGAEGEKGWGVGRARFSLGADVTGPAIHICVVAVKGGELVVDVTWQECAVDIQVGEGVTADLKAWLGHFGK